VTRALQKLDRMTDWNKRLASDRLDHWKLEKLAKREQELADRLQQQLDQPAENDADRAREIEAIREEQGRLAAQTEAMRNQSRLLQESLQALHPMRLKRLAQAAQELAQQQRAMDRLTPDKIPKELAERASKLAQRQATLAERVQPFAVKNQGPKLSVAQDAANSLKQLQVEEALEHQKEHEKRLQEWLEQLLPGIAPNTLRNQALKLAKQQKAVRNDLEKLGSDLPQLNEQMLRQRLQDLVTRQKELHEAIGKLDIDRTDERARQVQKNAQETARQARDQLAAKDAVNAFDTMENVERELKALAGIVPNNLPKERSDVKDPVLRGRIEQVEKYLHEQQELRKETEKVLADWMKSASHSAGGPVREQMKKLASDLLELSQQTMSPEARAMAKEAAQATDRAKEAMEASKLLKEQGEVGKAKMMDENAAKQLELAVKQLEKFAQEQAMKEMPKKDAEKSAEMVKEAEDKMRVAEKNLPRAPQKAQDAMKAAAQRLEQAAHEAKRLMVENQPPRPTSTPAPKGGLYTDRGVLSRAPAALKNVPALGKCWGELPGEMKTQLMQDFRTRYGEAYAEIIRDYFERLAETPNVPRKE
jgi:hypothetical protein